jgi:hypothetical protein
MRTSIYSCLLCEAGYYCDGEAATTNANALCDEGYYCTVGSPTNIPGDDTSVDDSSLVIKSPNYGG